ncbi:cytochrome c oxidase assembly protein [Spirillospora albida]|uniref:cytochrome c oxidase assembly protein n=1 Tax=Spirillospora albida TaxID=58123 RepID=UPI0004C15724|nr:cytochrome c oxidase assembly protein [Spirillospora albida]
MHDHHGPSAGTGPDAGTLLAVALIAPVAVYLLAAARLRRRGDAWPWTRDASFSAGAVALACAALGAPPGGPFTAHMGGHLLAGMIAPLLLILGRPLTLALRVLGPGRVRRALAGAGGLRAVRWAMFPPAAAALDVGGLWVLYRTPLLAAAHDRPALHALVHVHVVAAGILFAFSICRLDPVRHRWGLPLRAATLLAAGAGHAVLAKTLYAAPPPGVPVAADDLHAAARLMYYGGDLVELALACVLAVSWYRAQGRARARAERRAAVAG